MINSWGIYPESSKLSGEAKRYRYLRNKNIRFHIRSSNNVFHYFQFSLPQDKNI